MISNQHNVFLFARWQAKVKWKSITLWQAKVVKLKFRKGRSTNSLFVRSLRQDSSLCISHFNYSHNSDDVS